MTKKKFPTIKYTWKQMYPTQNKHDWILDLDETNLMLIWLDMLECDLENRKLDTAVSMLENIGIKC